MIITALIVNLSDVNFPPTQPVEEEPPHEISEAVASLMERVNTLKGQVNTQ